MKRRPKGYWTKDLVIEEFKLLSNEIKFFPDKIYLERNKKAYLANAVRSVGLTFREIRDILNFPQAIKERGYWNKENIIKELKEVEVSIKKFPTIDILASLGRQDIVGAIATHKISMSSLRSELGYDQIYFFRQICSHGKWSKDTVIQEIKAIESEIKKFPDQRILNALNRSDLSGAISDLNISYYELREILGYSPVKNPVNFWNEEKIIKEFNKVHNEIGEFPTQKKLKEIGRGELAGAIGSHGVSYRKLRELLGYENTKPEGYWDNFDNLAAEISKIIKNGRFPSLHKIKLEIGNSAKTATRFFGGIKEVAKRMGYDYVPSNLWVTSDGHHVRSYYEYLFDEFLYLNNIPHEVDGLIHESKKYRYDFKIGKYYIEIWGLSSNRSNKIVKEYHKKRLLKEKLYHDEKLDLISIEAAVFNKTINEIEEYFINLINSLEGKSWEGKANVITNLTYFRCFWNDDKILRELSILLKNYGTIPSLAWIETIDKKLYNAISYFGGKKYFFDKLGISTKVVHANKKWTPETILAKFKEISEKLGHFPTEKELKQTEDKYLQVIAHRNGLTLTAIAKALNYEPNKRNYMSAITNQSDNSKIPGQ